MTVLSGPVNPVRKDGALNPALPNGVNILPKFPDGRGVLISDRPIFAPPAGITQDADICFTNIFAWRKAYDYKISGLDGMVVVEGVHNGVRFFLPPIGGANASAVAYKLLSSPSTSARTIITHLPKPVSSELASLPGISIETDSASWDYVYKSADLAELTGQKYHAKRNLIKQFVEKYTARVEKLDGTACREALEFSERWCEQRGCASNADLEKEKCAICQMLEHFEELGLEGIMVRVSGDICAVAIGEELNPSTYAIHVEKGDHQMRGIYQFINHEFARRIAVKYEWINRESDAGAPGLRRAKMSYHPNHFVEKYSAEFLN